MDLDENYDDDYDKIMMMMMMMMMQVTLFRLNSLVADRATFSGSLIIVTNLIIPVFCMTSSSLQLSP